MMQQADSFLKLLRTDALPIDALVYSDKESDKHDGFIIVPFLCVFGITFCLSNKKL